MEVNGLLHAPAVSLPRKRPVPTEWEAGWAPKPVWTVLEKRNACKKDGFMFGPTVYGSVADALCTAMAM
jgi:hypothetical protein